MSTDNPRLVIRVPGRAHDLYFDRRLETWGSKLCAPHAGGMRRHGAHRSVEYALPLSTARMVRDDIANVVAILDHPEDQADRRALRVVLERINSKLRYFDQGYR